MHWMVVCRVRITKQTKEAYAFCFRLMFDQCKKDNPEFNVEKTLLGVVIDWSDAEAEGLRLAVLNCKCLVERLQSTLDTIISKSG